MRVVRIGAFCTCPKARCGIFGSSSGSISPRGAALRPRPDHPASAKQPRKPHRAHASAGSSLDTGGHDPITCRWFRADIKARTKGGDSLAEARRWLALGGLRAGAKRLERGLGRARPLLVGWLGLKAWRRTEEIQAVANQFNVLNSMNGP